jgi:hypothetical protein
LQVKKKYFIIFVAVVGYEQASMKRPVPQNQSVEAEKEDHIYCSSN